MREETELKRLLERQEELKRERLKESTVKLAEENDRWAGARVQQREARNQAKEDTKPFETFATDEQKQEVTRRRRQGRKASAEDKARSDVKRDKFKEALNDAMSETNEALRRFGTGTKEAADAFAALGKLSIDEPEMSEAEKVAIDKGFEFEDVAMSGDGMQEDWLVETISFDEANGGTIADDSQGYTTSDANVMDGINSSAGDSNGVIRIDIGEYGTEERIAAIRCPSCGWSMSIRTAKRGKKSGQKFLGCQQYPVCMTTYNIVVDGGRVMRLTPNYRPGPGADLGRDEKPTVEKVGIGTKRRRKIEL